ncbi:uncharacterized protein DUF6924 [Sphingomonas sp. F9_3S_D5_B_2]
MKDASPLVRTDFSSDGKWGEILALATAETPEGFRAELEPLEDPSLDGKSPKALIDAGRWGSARVLFVVDAHTLDDCECSIACVDLSSKPGRTFRAVPSALWGVENNVRLGNMEFDEFADAADEGGMFRGF